MQVEMAKMTLKVTNGRLLPKREMKRKSKRSSAFAEGKMTLYMNSKQLRDS